MFTLYIFTSYTLHRYTVTSLHPIPYIVTPLQTNTFIENLDMSDNKVGDAGAVSIANMLTENYFITELSMSLK